jgi:hypothetical protein
MAAMLGTLFGFALGWLFRSLFFGLDQDCANDAHRERDEEDERRNTGAI